MWFTYCETTLCDILKFISSENTFIKFNIYPIHKEVTKGESKLKGQSMVDPQVKTIINFWLLTEASWKTSPEVSFNEFY